MIRKLVLHNYRTKIVSALLAVGLWWFIYAGQHPRVIATYPAPIKYENLAPVLKVAKAPETVKVRLQGDARLLEKIDADNLGARVDLGGLKEGDHSAKVRIVNGTGARLLGRPAQVSVTLEKINKIELPVTIQFKGEPPEGFRLGEGVNTRPEKVAVYGDMEELRNVARIVAVVDLAEKRENFRVNPALKAIDESGVMIKSIKVDPGKARVDVPIESSMSRVVPVKPAFTGGDIAEDFPDADFYPMTVKLIGDEAALAEIDSVTTAEFDLMKCSGGGVYPIGIVLPKNVFSDVKQITLSCTSDQNVSRSFSVTLNTINLCRGCSAALDPNEIEIEASGPAREVNDIKITDISAFVDLTGLGDGENSVTPHTSIGRFADVVRLKYPTSAITVYINHSGKPRK